MIEQYFNEFNSPQEPHSNKKAVSLGNIIVLYYQCLVFFYPLLFKTGYYNRFVFLHDLNSKTNLTVSPESVCLWVEHSLQQAT